MAKENLYENEEFMSVMESAAEEDYTAAAKKIAEMEEDAETTREATGDEAEANEYKANKDGVWVEYDLKSDEIYSAVDAFQKKTIYKKNIIYTVLLGLIVLSYGYGIVVNPDNIFGYVVAFGCALIIYFLWSLPIRHKKSAALAADATDDKFTAAVYENVMFVGEGEQTVKIPFTEKTFAIEKAEGFVIGADKERVFMLPKRCLDEEKQQKLHGILEKSLGGRYEIK